MQQELAEAGDEAQRRYEDETDPDSRTASGLTSAISAGTEAKRQKLTTAFTKYLSIANLENGKHFLSEILTKLRPQRSHPINISDFNPITSWIH